MESARLEQLERGLRKVLTLLDEHGGQALDAGHPAVRAAGECELMLPEVLTRASLEQAVRHKIDVVQVLLARAREHESLPPDVQLAADEGYLASTDELSQAAGPAP
ncbi:MAG: hypothetical protein ACLGI6_11600 [Gammaproteobacteria bacterium]